MALDVVGGGTEHLTDRPRRQLEGTKLSPGEQGTPPLPHSISLSFCPQTPCLSPGCCKKWSSGCWEKPPVSVSTAGPAPSTSLSSYCQTCCVPATQRAARTPAR